LLRRPIVAASIVFAAGLLITGLAALRWSRSDSYSAEMRVHFMEVRTSDQILARMGIYEQLLQGARAMVTAVGPQNISRQLFKRYSEGQDLARRFPAVRGLGLVRRLTRADQPGPADDHSMSYVAQLVEPEAANADLVGVDLGSDANSREAAERSLRSGMTTLSAPMTWSPLGLRPPDALLLWLPIYTETAALSAAVRRTRYKRGRAAQAPENIGAKGGVIPYARECHWVQGLKQEGADAAGHHRREVGVDFPANGVGSK
jgi:CHASE1-domain containing sensor protein